MSPEEHAKLIASEVGKECMTIGATPRTAALETVDRLLQAGLLRTVTQPPARALARRDGPATSKLAAQMVAPKVGTRKSNVLAELRRASPEFISGDRLSTPHIGGAQGLKRLRELRADGWPVETRPPPDGDGTWLYRLRPEPGQPDPYVGQGRLL